MNPEDLFRRWFVQPIQLLENKIEKGDGAFVALMAVLPLYERAIVGRLKLSGATPNEDAIKAEVRRDLNIDSNVRGKFWSIFRNGFMHQGMGLDGITKWRISSKYGGSPTLLNVKGVDFICIDPWKFSAHVLQMFKDTPALITASDSFPFADIFEKD
jgi:hypothetical protein